MKILITEKQKFKREFVYSYLPKFIYTKLLSDLDSNKLKTINEQYDFDTKELLKFAIINLKVSEDQNSYTIEINKNLKYNKQNLSSLINMITFGNRSIKGYNILYKLFNYVCDNIDGLYTKWLGGTA